MIYKKRNATSNLTRIYYLHSLKKEKDRIPQTDIQSIFNIPLFFCFQRKTDIDFHITILTEISQSFLIPIILITIA